MAKIGPSLMNGNHNSASVSVYHSENISNLLICGMVKVREEGRCAADIHGEVYTPFGRTSKNIRAQKCACAFRTEKPTDCKALVSA